MIASHVRRGFRFLVSADRLCPKNNAGGLATVAFAVLLGGQVALGQIPAPPGARPPVPPLTAPPTAVPGAVPGTVRPARPVVPPVPATSEGGPAPTPSESVSPSGDAPPQGKAQDVTLATANLLLTDYLAAFNHHNAADAAGFWLKDAVHIDQMTGGRTEGRANLEESFKRLFADHPTIHMTAMLSDARAITPDVITVSGKATLFRENEAPDVSAFKGVLVKSEGPWKIDSIEEFAPHEHGSSQEALRQLGWLVGEWRDDISGDQTIRSTVRWSPNYAFLIRSYHVDLGEERQHEGTQIIGWDAMTKEVRSWNFESDGSFGEGVWSNAGREWTIRMTMHLADGRIASARQIMTQNDGDSYTVQAVGREVDGVPLPNIDPIRVVRQPAGNGEPVAPEAPAVSTFKESTETTNPKAPGVYTSNPGPLPPPNPVAPSTGGALP